MRLDISIFAVMGALLTGCADVVENSVELREAESGIEVLIDGKLFTVYRFDVHGTPILFPVIGPDGVRLTRNYPMVEGVEGEDNDHPHHRSIWFGHREVNGHSFWSFQNGGGVVKQKGILLVPAKGAGGAATILTENDLVTSEGVVLGGDEREIAFWNLGNGEVRLDYTVRILANQGIDLHFENDKDGLMGIRVAHWMKLENRKGEAMGGGIINSEGVTGREAWGKRALWVDYFGTSPKGPVYGVAMFDHPENLRHPTWWHARHYGLLSANPFGQGDFEKGVAPENAGDFTLAEGERLELRYGFYFHRGNAEEANVGEQYARFAEGGK